MEDEFNALIQNQTWQLVPRPPNRPVIGCKWVYKTKPSADTTSHRCKARLVAKGFHQVGDIDYHETFSPIIKVTTTRLFLALVVNQEGNV